MEKNLCKSEFYCQKNCLKERKNIANYNIKIVCMNEKSDMDSKLVQWTLNVSASIYHHM